MTPAGRNKTVSFIPFLAGSAIASILVLAVVVAIVIARSGGSDVALVSPVARAAMALTICAAEPQAFQ